MPGFFDAAGKVDYPGTSWAHTCAADATALIVVARYDSTGAITATFAGAPMTWIASVTAPGSTVGLAIFFLANPLAGAHGVQVTPSSGASAGASCSYRGTTGPPDASQPSTQSGGTTFTPVITTVSDQAWVVMGAFDSSGTNPTASAGCVGRADAGGGGSVSIFDSNGGQTPPGPVSMTLGVHGANNAAIQITLPTVSPGPGRMLLVF